VVKSERGCDACDFPLVSPTKQTNVERFAADGQGLKRRADHARNPVAHVEHQYAQRRDTRSIAA
jgi:hypothetical protein